ncbi:MAG: hypothetical protein RR959_08095 [Erysipelotrichaceae bacterium]
MNNLSLRERFEGIPHIKNMLEDYRIFYYSIKGNYSYTGTNSKREEAVMYVNGAWWMFKELESKINCNHNWIGKSENQYCSKCGIGDE